MNLYDLTSEDRRILINKDKQLRCQPWFLLTQDRETKPHHQDCVLIDLAHLYRGEADHDTPEARKAYRHLLAFWGVEEEFRETA
jgi:hypothetical protein